MKPRLGRRHRRPRARPGRLLERGRVTVGDRRAQSGRAGRGRIRRRRRRPVELTIYGAASLKGALDKAKAAYEAANPGRR